jgi:hypothetical protein
MPSLPNIAQAFLPPSDVEEDIVSFGLRVLKFRGIEKVIPRLRYGLPDLCAEILEHSNLDEEDLFNLDNPDGILLKEILRRAEGHLNQIKDYLSHSKEEQEAAYPTITIRLRGISGRFEDILISYHREDVGHPIVRAVKWMSTLRLFDPSFDLDAIMAESKREACPK